MEQNPLYARNFSFRENDAKKRQTGNKEKKKQCALSTSRSAPFEISFSDRLEIFTPTIESARPRDLILRTRHPAAEFNDEMMPINQSLPKKTKEIDQRLATRREKRDADILLSP